MQSSTPFPQTKSEHTVSLIPNGLLLVAAQRKKSDLRLICVFYNRLGGWEPLSIYRQSPIFSLVTKNIF